LISSRCHERPLFLPKNGEIRSRNGWNAQNGEKQRKRAESVETQVKPVGRRVENITVLTRKERKRAGKTVPNSS